MYIYIYIYRRVIDFGGGDRTNGTRSRPASRPAARGNYQPSNKPNRPISDLRFTCTAIPFGGVCPGESKI